MAVTIATAVLFPSRPRRTTRSRICAISCQCFTDALLLRAHRDGDPQRVPKPPRHELWPAEPASLTRIRGGAGSSDGIPRPAVLVKGAASEHHDRTDGACQQEGPSPGAAGANIRRMATFEPGSVRADFPALAQTVHAGADGRPLVYLDSAATTQMPEPVIQAVARFA